MERVAPNPKFIAQFIILAEDPTLNSLLNQNRSISVGIFTITTIAIAALTGVRYLYTRSYSSLGIGAVVMLANLSLGVRAVKKAQRTDTKERDARFKQATEGIKEGLDYYRKRKQDRGIEALNGKDISWNSDLLKGTAPTALNFFESYYNGEGFIALKPDIFGIYADPEVPTYRKILPIAKQFLSSKTTIKEIKELQNEAYKFIYGYSSPNFNDTTLNSNVSVDDKKIKDKGYLDVSVVNDKIVAKAWVGTL